MSALGFGLYLAFMCSWFLHLPTRYPILGSVRADLVLVCIIVVLCVAGQAGADEQPGNKRTRKLLWVLLLYAALTIPLVEWPGSAVKTGFPQFFKAFVFFYFTATLVTTVARLRYLLFVFVACESFRVFEPLYLHITEGYWGSSASMADWETMYRLAGAPDDVVNPNGLAFIVLTVIPFLHFLTRGSVAGRVLYLTALPLLIYALSLTGSRSGMIGLAAFVGLAWLKSSHKVLFLAVAVVGASIAVPQLSSDLTDRYASIYRSDTKNSGSVQFRLEGLQDNLAVTMHRPVFGHGLGTSLEANVNFGTHDQPSHNLYIEVAQELGICGLVIFVMFVRSVFGGLRDASVLLRQSTAPPAILRDLVPALEVFLGMNLLFSLASYGLSGYEWYLIAGLTDVIGRLVHPAQAASAPVSLPIAARVSYGGAAIQPLSIRS